jgi:hypothetical protein
MLVLALIADLVAATGGRSCALERRLLVALDQYCAVAPEEQPSCAIARSRLRACSSGAAANDNGAFIELIDARIKNGYCLHLSFSRRTNGAYRLDSFTKGKSQCDCDCCP